MAPAIAEPNEARLPAPPANGVMGFVVHRFVHSVIQEKTACPDGPQLRNRDIFLNSLPPAESERLGKKENEAEFARRWRATLQNADGANMCTHYALFPDRPTTREVQSKLAWGFNLDGDEGDGSGNPEGCAHENFVSPAGDRGIDNQAYRALGCKLEWRGIDGVAGDIVRAYEGNLASGEWSQVLLLRGVDSLVNDNEVEVILANTPDRPVVDASGKYIWNASYTVSVQPPRERNVLRGKIVNGVLTTEPKQIKLAQTYGQGGGRDLRGLRMKWDLHKGRLRLSFQPDGSLKGFVGGYQRIDDLVTSPSIGGMGSLMTGGIDCAGEYNTLKKLADGLRDPRTGQCWGVSNAVEVQAVPAFVNDLPSANRPRHAFDSTR